MRIDTTCHLKTKIKKISSAVSRSLNIHNISKSIYDRRDFNVLPQNPHFSNSHCPLKGRKEGSVLFNDALNTFYLRLYGVRQMVKVHSDSERGNPLPPHGLLFAINSKGSFICTIPQTG